MRYGTLLALLCALLAGAGLALAQQETLTPKQALDRALDEERHSAAYLDALINKFGEKMPLNAIKEFKDKAEHALVTQYERFELTAPGNRWRGSGFNIPDDYAIACDIGEFMEVDTAATYLVLVGRVEDRGLRSLFTRLGQQSRGRQVNLYSRVSNAWRPLRDQDIDVDQEDQAKNAQAAADAFTARFNEALDSSLEAGEPVAAMNVCEVVAPRLAREVGDEFKVRMGRTSWRRTNQDNVGPLWTEWLADERPVTPKHAADKNRRLGSIFPIITTQSCLSCHGARDRIPEAVQQALDERFIGNEGFGFEEGDLRAWIWVESPPVSYEKKK